MNITETERTFVLHDLVFAKFSNSIPWPGQVSKRDGDKYYIDFYGTGNGAWLNARNVVPYVDDYKKLYVTEKNLKRKNFKMAVDQIEEELRSGFDITHVDDVEIVEDVKKNKKKKSINPWDKKPSRSKVKTEKANKSEWRAQLALIKDLEDEEIEALKLQYKMVKTMKDICIALSLVEPKMDLKAALSHLEEMVDLWPNVTKIMLVKNRSVVDNLQRLTRFAPESSSGEKIHEQESFTIRSHAELNLQEIYKMFDATDKAEFDLIFEQQRAEFAIKFGDIDENQLFVLLSYDELKKQSDVDNVFKKPGSSNHMNKFSDDPGDMKNLALKIERANDIRPIKLEEKSRLTEVLDKVQMQIFLNKQCILGIKVDQIGTALNKGKPPMDLEAGLTHLEALFDIWPDVTKIMILKQPAVVQDLQDLTLFTPESSSAINKVQEQNTMDIRSYAELNLQEIYKIFDASSKSEFELIFKRQSGFIEKVGDMDEEELNLLTSLDFNHNC